MQMTMKITNRDKVLLTVLAMVLIAVGFIVWIILPQLDKKSELETQIADAQTQQFDMETQISLLPTYKKQVEKKTAEREKLIADLYPLMENREVDKMITDMILSHNLEARDFTVSLTPEGRALNPYSISTLGLKKALEEANGDSSSPSTSAEGEGGETDPAQETASDILVSDVSVSAIGSMENLQALIDSVTNDYPALRVVSYSLDKNDSLSLDEQNDVLMSNTLSLNLEIYMYVG